MAGARSELQVELGEQESPLQRLQGDRQQPPRTGPDRKGIEKLGRQPALLGDRRQNDRLGQHPGILLEEDARVLAETIVLATVTEERRLSPQFLDAFSVRTGPGRLLTVPLQALEGRFLLPELNLEF